MKNSLLLYPALLLFLLPVNGLNAQKSIDRINDYYKADAYYLTIKKIKELKPRLQSKMAIQYILADCYWKIGLQDKTLPSNKEMASEAHKPGEVMHTSEEVFGKQLKKQLYAPIEIESKQFICFDNEQAESVPKMPDLALVIPDTNKQIQIVESDKEVYTVAVVSVKKEEITNDSIPQPIAVDPPLAAPAVNNTIEAKNSSTLFDLLQDNDFKTSGKYRIRIPIKIDKETEELQKIQSLETVSVSTWADKKIILAGYFDSVAKAQSIIDLHLKDKYRHVVVVTKVGVQYKSLGPNDYVAK